MCIYIFRSTYKTYPNKHIKTIHFQINTTYLLQNIPAHNISRYKTYETTKHIIMLSISNYKTYQKQNISKKKHIKRKSYQNLIFLIIGEHFSQWNQLCKNSEKNNFYIIYYSDQSNSFDLIFLSSFGYILQ